MKRYDLEGGKLVPAEHGEWTSEFQVSHKLERLEKLERAARKVVAWLERTEASRARYKELAELLP